MIGCPCGGFTASASERKRGAVLKYERCGACGRCGQWRYEHDGTLVAEGEQARRQFQAAKAGETT